jgi:hypothetical protein
LGGAIVIELGCVDATRSDRQALSVGGTRPSRGANVVGASASLEVALR